MNFFYQPKSELEKFGVKVYNLLVDNFPQTFFVGGMVRDLLLKKKVVDIDIATEAKPDQITKLLSARRITASGAGLRFGSITARQRGAEVEITALRKDLSGPTRYPKVAFVRSPKVDSQRRDFTINALYLSLKPQTILDFHNGVNDIKSRQIKFIGRPEKRIKQDPLRIVRALRFALILDFKLEKESKMAIKNNFKTVSQLTKTKIQKEMDKIKSVKQKKVLEKVINNPKLLDKYFK